MFDMFVRPVCCFELFLASFVDIELIKSHAILNNLERELSLKSSTPFACQMPRQLVAAGESQVPQQQDQDVEEMEEEPVEQEGEGYGE